MNHISFGGLLAVAVIALVAPLLVSLAPRARIPADVAAIAGGILVGPSVLGWVKIDTPVTVLSLLGLAFLLFLAGLELDLDRLRGRLLRWPASLRIGTTRPSDVAESATATRNGLRT